MKQQTSFFLVIFFAAAFLHISCQRDVESPGTTPPPPPPVSQTVTASLAGRVTDENNLPVKGAVVNTGTYSTVTDVNGLFTFKNILTEKGKTYVRVEKPNYFNGSRTLTVNANVSNYLDIQLIPKLVSGTFLASAGGSVTIPSGGKIDFTSNTIINSLTNTSYTGSVSVSAFFINPETAGFSAIMPGALRGITSSTQEVGLRSFGMMAVELTGAAGEKLNLAAGKTATISFPIPVALQTLAPSSIPLWSFDEQTGMWKEEGTAIRQGNNYTGAVAHFSFWNCDAPFSIVDFEALIKDQNGNALSNFKIEIRNAGDTLSLSAFGYTDSVGKVSGKIPANKNLQLRVFDKCKNIIHTQNFTTGGSSSNLGTITVNLATAVNAGFSGTVVNCMNVPVTNGFVNILLGGTNYRAEINNGAYSYKFLPAVLFLLPVLLL